MGGADLMITITDRSRGGEFAAWFQGQGVPLVLTLLGQGTATTEILDCLGLEATEKAVLLCVTPHSPRLVRRAAKELWLDIPGRGILMTVPVSTIGGAAARDYLLQQEAEERMERERTHELIVVITNQGCTDKVIHAEGTGAELARKFLGVSIAAERELIFILTRKEDRSPIMKAVMSQAGIHSAAQSLAFSLPVSDIAGLRQLDGES